MSSIELRRVSVDIPIYDVSNLRLFRPKTALNALGVGSDEISRSSGVLRVKALSEVTFSLSSGDRLALIGHNGAGKTTLLRLLAGIYVPSMGQVTIQGSVCLYGANVPSNPDASGYENIELALRLNSVDRSDFARYISEIEDFTELGVYLRLPTRTYSAGMIARLSFAIATMLRPEILLIDEGIGAGDRQFAEKAEARIKEFTDSASIVVLASHDPSLLRRMCTKGAVFAGGKLEFVGGVEEALAHYQSDP